MFAANVLRKAPGGTPASGLWRGEDCHVKNSRLDDGI